MKLQQQFRPAGRRWERRAQYVALLPGLDYSAVFGVIVFISLLHPVGSPVPMRHPKGGLPRNISLPVQVYQT